MAIAATAPAALLSLALGLTAAAVPVPAIDTPPSTRIFDRHGVPLAQVRNGAHELAESVQLTQLSPWLVPALIAAEDQRFFRHPGVDPIAIARAAWHALRRGELHSGASTLTQQLARTLFERPRSLSGKWREVALALKLEWTFDKPQLLELYLNRAYFGPLVRGVETAASQLFDKPSAALSLAEAATLVALLKGPSHYSPTRHPQRLIARRNWVIRRLLERGQVNLQTASLAQRSPLVLHRGHVTPGAFHLVRAAAQDQLDGSRNQPEALAHTLRTTLDAGLQAEVEAALRALPRGPNGTAATAAAALVIENETGAVRAYVGSPDYAATESLGQVDGVLATRSPGSTLKPFLYALAFETLALSPASVLSDLPVHFPTPRGFYRPRNYDLRYRGPVRVRAALATSLNVPAVALLDRIGVNNWLAQLHALGLSTLDQPGEHYGLSLALGGGEVRLLDLSVAYLTLARDGVYVSPRFFVGAAQQQRRVISAAATRQITDILADPEARNPAFGRGLSFEFPVALKTGTSKGYRDSWVMGYSAHATVGVWVGNFDGRPTRQLTGAMGAGPIFEQLMRAAERHLADSSGAAATLSQIRSGATANARLCALSGLIPGRGCQHTLEERFWVGAAPQQVCDWHTLQCGPAGCRSHLRLPTRFAAFAARPLDSTAGARARPPRRAGVSSTAAPCSEVRPSRRRGSPPDGRLLSPADCAHFLLDLRVPRQQQSLLLIAAAEAGEIVDYWVDGARVGQARAPEPWPWPLSPGKHRIEARIGPEPAGAARIEVH